jgi:hypothetical protein
MGNRKGKHNLLLMASIFLLAIAASCRTLPSHNQANESSGITYRKLARIEDRPFMLYVGQIREEYPPGSGQWKTYRILCINGDDRSISYYSATGPYIPVVQGRDIKFGGHTFTLTPTPGEYLSDGKLIKLSSGARQIHVFSDGEYQGIESR